MYCVGFGCFDNNG